MVHIWAVSKWECDVQNWKLELDNRNSILLTLHGMFLCVVGVDSQLGNTGKLQAYIVFNIFKCKLV